MNNFTEAFYSVAANIYIYIYLKAIRYERSCNLRRTNMLAIRLYHARLEIRMINKYACALLKIYLVYHDLGVLFRGPGKIKQVAGLRLSPIKLN